MARPTIKDVSKLAGVSIGTVSNVVNNHPNISFATRSKVERAIEKLGYKTNRAAKSLPKGHTGLLGYRMPDERKLNSSMDRFLHQVVESAGSIGLEVLLFTPRPGQSELDAYAEVLRRGGVDGFILSGIEYNDERVEYLSSKNVPFAAFGRAKNHENSVWIDVDGAIGTKQAVQHLAEKQRSKIAFLGWPEGSLTGDERFSGWVEGMNEAKLPYSDGHIVRTQDSFETGRLFASTLLEGCFDGVVCVSDTFAFGVMAGLRDKGSIPGQAVSVVGFDNVSATELVSPGLSSVDQPMSQVGRELVYSLSKILQGENDISQNRLVPPKLVVRGSSDSQTP